MLRFFFSNFLLCATFIYFHSITSVLILFIFCGVLAAFWCCNKSKKPCSSIIFNLFLTCHFLAERSKRDPGFKVKCIWTWYFCLLSVIHMAYLESMSVIGLERPFYPSCVKAKNILFDAISMRVIRDWHIRKCVRKCSLVWDQRLLVCPSSFFLSRRCFSKAVSA